MIWIIEGMKFSENPPLMMILLSLALLKQVTLGLVPISDSQLPSTTLI
jgi:hypothetical protein